MPSRPYNQTGYRFYSQTEQHPDSTAATTQSNSQTVQQQQCRDRYVSGTYQDRQGYVPGRWLSASLFRFLNPYAYEQNSSGFRIYRPNHCSHPPRAHTIRRGFSSRIL